MTGHLALNRDELPVVYVAGKVTGMEYGEAWAQFKLKQQELENTGFYVINPLDHIEETEHWQKAMRQAVVMLACCDHICLLDNWHLSEGATLERNLSLPLGINTIEI